MKLRRPTRVASAAALASALVLSACTGGNSDPGPTGTTPPSTSATPPPTSSATPPPTSSTKTTPAVDPVLAKIPKAARPKTIKGAEEFASFYVLQINKAFEMPDPREILVFAKPSCKACTAFVDSAATLKSEGQRHKSAALRVVSTSVVNFQPPKVRVAVSIKQVPVDVVDKSGKVVRTTQSDTGTLILDLSYEHHWLVDDFAVAE